MDKLNTTEINDVLKDVRSSYRLIALYQKRLLDIVKYTVNSYNVRFDSGWSKFSNAASNGKKANIDNLSWDWLSMYLYEFNLGGINMDGENYHLKIVHQADTGFYDASTNKKISHGNAHQFGDADRAVTRLFFVLSKNANGCPMQHILNGNLTANDNTKISKGDWLAVPYNLERFSNKEITDNVLQEFNEVCKETFGVDIIKGIKNKKEIIDIINPKYDAFLTNSNTSYSYINKTKKVWWFNIPVLKFEGDVHLLLNTTERVIWIFLPKGSIDLDLFKIREDKGAVDLEISTDINSKYLQDIKSGGTGFDFSEFVKEEIYF